MFVTDDSELNQRVLFLRDHGRNPGDRFFLNHEIAFKYRMNAVTAALGIAQMERIDDLIAHKRAIFGWYHARLKDLNCIRMNAEPAGTENSYWMVTIIADAALGLDKFALMKALDERNIDSRPFFSPLSTLPAFDDRPASKRFVTAGDRGQSIARCGVNLPSGYNMTEARVDLVSRAVREILTEGPRHGQISKGFKA